MANWTFITNHGAVLALISMHRKITAREIAVTTGITERSVQRIINDLEREGYIQKRRVGRVNQYEVNRELPMRHATHQDIAVRELLNVLGQAL